MTSATTPVSTQREPELIGQTVVVMGGSAGIGLETARRARVEGADVILTGRNPDRVRKAALELGGQRRVAFDAKDAASRERFFQDLPTPIDHVMVTAGGPRYGPLLEMEAAQVREALSEHVVLALEVARNAVGKMRPGGTLLFMGGTGGRRIGHGLRIGSAAPAPLPPRIVQAGPDPGTGRGDRRRPGVPDGGSLCSRHCRQAHRLPDRRPGRRPPTAAAGADHDRRTGQRSGGLGPARLAAWVPRSN